MKKFFIAAVLILAAGLMFGQDFDFGGGFPGGISGIPGGGSNKARDKADDAMDKLNGNIPMRFFNAMDRKPIEGGVVTIPNLGDFKTNSQGKIVFPVIPDGNYTLVFVKEGFITSEIEFRVLQGSVDLNWFSVSPGFSEMGYRIVLDWGEKPADLDMHFVKTGGSGGYHISYYNLKLADDGNATLDRDDTSGYGPETVTIGRTEARASYTCYVDDYTNRNNAASVQMAAVGAVIRVYSQNRLLHTIRIPANGKGRRWNVFKIERGLLTPVNTVQ